jgi:16S rRNA (cytosine1402-N4)-methyltransferase
MLHEPVLVAEVLEHLEPSRGGLFVDCTVGLGGHARAMLDAGATRLIGFDRDRAAVDRSREALKPYADRVELAHADYRQLGDLLDSRGIASVDGILADLGVSSMQLDSPGRGFSFRRDDALDMRMDTSTGPTAADVLRTIDERALGT